LRTRRNTSLIIQGAMLSVLDSDKRLADHFGGKVRAVALLVVELLVSR
jgi:hypothetical protein